MSLHCLVCIDMSILSDLLSYLIGLVLTLT